MNRPLLLLLLSTFLVVGCVETGPEPQQRTNERKSSAELTTELFTPLVPICLKALDSGQPVSETEMAALGYAKFKPLGQGQGFRKKLDMNSKSDFGVSHKGCWFTVTPSIYIVSGGVTLARLLFAEGYTNGKANNTEIPFHKGGKTVKLKGYTYNGLTRYEIVRMP